MNPSTPDDAGSTAAVGTGRTLSLTRCADCPFFGSDYSINRDVCEAIDDPDELLRPDVLAREEVSPGPPPEWCPLRGSPLTLTVG